MRKSILTIAAIGTAAAFALTACGSDSDSSGSSGGKTGATTGGKSASSGKTQVGVILPDTTSSTRYTEFDTPLLTKAFKAAGIKVDIQNAGGDKTKFASLAQNMISEGVSVLIIDSIDAPSGAAVEAQAKTAGVKVIDYDRVNLGGSADYYVSFDNEKIGQLQGQSLVQCLKTAKAPNPAQVIQMDGGTDVDNNAVLFKSGAEKVLKADSSVKVVADSVVKGWTVSNAAPAFTQALAANSNKVDGVYAANDDIANAVIGVLKSKGLNGKVPVTGQDAGVEGLQNILRGDQCATIYKSYAKEADAASKLAIALVKGQDVASAGVTLTKFNDPKGKRDLQAFLLPAQIVTKSNVKVVVDSGQVKAADLCKGLTSQCKTAGISS
ncbi:monosaccharide ABC transporter substrate-binding protein, CUT2 family [Jatrophihabitans endophyticus]|uniref:Monosaccharide ABC transporter substrate-binding protein, CUT2 family n=1 Tax=Jatrophihabitans endophyticus TaxID=1206085 RepID=A0A1M5N529_9ACTN|nr:substrate-binding domain-containing protein [Jatrophihabitans endophyticus]SHG84542.1 monosaccharide ABC transporter substrate-binding protein, CUT2 family [Jatrophihabitans endophyticus]